MTEQIEDDFWAAERARDAAGRGRHADPSACGTCRNQVASGGQVAHDECAQRATLLPAPDAPGYELITGMPVMELAALPPRFHIPVFVESSTPKLWVCAVCWGDGWSTQWPCATAVEHGTAVFTLEHEAETAATRQTVELASYRALELGDPDGRVSASCDNPEHPTWLRAEDDTRGCPWCQIAGLEAERDRARQQRDGWRHEVRCADARLRELEAERAKYVGKEPTVAEEMAELRRRLDAVLDLCDQTAASGIVSGGPFTVDAVRDAADGDCPAASRPALPWAHAMDDGDLHEFLNDLVSAAMGRWHVGPDGEVPDRTVLANVERVCAEWRTSGQGLRGDEPTAETGDGR